MRQNILQLTFKWWKLIFTICKRSSFPFRIRLANASAFPYFTIEHGSVIISLFASIYQCTVVS